jgi:hypothetical protein
LRSILVVSGLAAAFLPAVPGRSSQLAVILLNPANWGSGRPPADWQIKVVHGRPDFSVCTDGDGSCLHLRSSKSSFALERGLDVDPYENRYLAWRWKVTALPNGGDFRRAATDDQAAQVLVAFADRRVLTYIWDSTAPKGTMQNASSIPLVHIYAVVCESGAAETNRWVPEARDVAADYERAYGKAAPHVKGLRIQINSQHTGSVAESYFGEVVFRSKPPE